MANTKSMSFDQSGANKQYLARASGDLTGFSTLTQFTIEFDIKAATPAATGQICARWGGTAGDRQFTLALLTTGALSLTCRTTNSQNPAITTNASALTDNTWQHFAFQFNPANLTGKIYKNNAEITSTTSGAQGTLNAGAYPLEIGAREAGTVNPITMLLDNFRFWNDARTLQEVQDNYQIELVGNESGLIACYHVNDNTLDLTANDNDLTAYNSPTYSTDVPFSGASQIIGPFPTHFRV